MTALHENKPRKFPTPWTASTHWMSAVWMLAISAMACGDGAADSTENVGGRGGSLAGAGGADTTDGEGGNDKITINEIVCDGAGTRFVTEVISVRYGPGQDFGRNQMPDIVFGPPHGAGCCAGSTDVVSLGNGGTVVLGFGTNGIVDGPGVDFVVFENAFEAGSNVFAELATVSVSDDLEHWTTFPCDAIAPPYGSCAGHEPVYLSEAELPIDPATSGGDLFDLADIGVDRARFIKITDRADLDGFSGTFDLDAVGIVHPACP